MAVPEGLRTSPFHGAYPPALDTEWIDVMGYAVPLWVSDPEDEYAAFRERVGLLEYSMLYRWDLSGPGAVATADAVFSRNVAMMQPGTLAYGVIVGEDGRMIDDPTVAYYDAEHILIVGGNPAVGEVIEARLAPQTTLQELREQTCVLSVQGPQSRALLQTLTTTDLSNEAFPYYSFLTGIDIAGVQCQINRIGFTAELGYELVAPVQDAPRLIAACQTAGASMGATVCGAAALMMCRIEAGMVMAGLEYDELSTPFECRLGWAVDFDKGPFQGRGALEAHRLTAKDRVMTVGITGAPDGLDGAPILHDGQVIGLVTMAVPSPALGGVTIAMAKLAKDLAVPDTALVVQAPEGERQLVVLSTPVYDPKRTRVRS